MVEYIISKIFTYLFLPPGIFVLIFIFAFFVSKKFKWVFLFSAFFLWITSITPVRDLLLNYLGHVKRDSNVKTASAVVVLSGSSSPNGVIKTYPEAFERLMYGYIVACMQKLPLVIAGGGINTNDSRNMLLDLNVIEMVSKCKPRVILETKSLNTHQNAKFVSMLFSQKRIKKDIYLVTSFYHIRRAMLLFHHFGFKIIPKPVGFMKNSNYTWLDFLPHMINFYFLAKQFMNMLEF